MLFCQQGRELSNTNDLSYTLLSTQQVLNKILLKAGSHYGLGPTLNASEMPLDCIAVLSSGLGPPVVYFVTLMLPLLPFPPLPLLQP